jgi:hypothetical protein
MSQFKVITCLSCGNRQLFEVDHIGAIGKLKRHLERGCACGQNDSVVANFTYYANAKKFLEIPLRKEFVLIHRALRSKIKVIDLMKEMVDSLSKVVAASELKDDPKPLKDVAKWLQRMVMCDIHQLDPEEKQEEDRKAFLASLKEETNGDTSVPDV